MQLIAIKKIVRVFLETSQTNVEQGLRKPPKGPG